MMWRESLSASQFLTDEIRDRSLDFAKISSGKRAYEPRWKECVGMTAKFLPIATGALYVKTYFDEKSKDAASEMVDAIKHEFREILETVSWMDEKTRSSAFRKVDKMEKHIGYPSELMDKQKLTEFYKKLEIPDHEYLTSVMNCNKFRVTSEMEKLREIINKTHWEAHSDVAIANAYYTWSENSICKLTASHRLS